MDSLLTQIARLYRYPDAGWRLQLAQCTDVAGDHGDDVYLPLRSFFDWASTVSDHGLEEAFTQTFDLNPKCTLEVGWHLYGEDYNRGAFMARLRDQFRDFGVDETIELPDHLTNVLPLLEALPVDDGASLSDQIVLPAMSAMKEALLKVDSPFQALLAATVAVIQEIFEIEQVRPIVKQDKSIPMTFMGKEIGRG